MDKKNWNYYNMLGFYRDNGKENGNYYLGFRVWVLEFMAWGLGHWGFNGLRYKAFRLYGFSLGWVQRFSFQV